MCCECSEQATNWADVVFALGFVGMVVGLAWMVFWRITRD